MKHDVIRGMRKCTEMEGIVGLDEFLGLQLGPATTICRYSNICFELFSCKWSGYSYKRQSYFSLKSHEARHSNKSVANKGSAKAWTSTSLAALNLQGAATVIDEESALRYISVGKPAVWYELGLVNSSREKALQASNGDRMTESSQCLLDATKVEERSRSIRFLS